MSAYPLNLGWRFPSLAHTDDLDYADLYKRINQEDDFVDDEDILLVEG